MAYQQHFQWFADDFATTDESNKYYSPITLPEGYIWRIDKFLVHAKTNYIAVDTNYQTFLLCDSSGNVIATVANGSSTTGVAIGPEVVTGIMEAADMTSTYQYIDCTSAEKTIYVKTAATGSGRAMLGICGTVLATPQRKALANLS